MVCAVVNSLKVEGFQPLKGALQTFRRRMDVALRDRDATVARDPLYGESVRASLASSCQHRVSKRVYHEVCGQFQIGSDSPVLMAK